MQDIDGSENVRVTAPGGTDLTMSLRGARRRRTMVTFAGWAEAATFHLGRLMHAPPLHGERSHRIRRIDRAQRGRDSHQEADIAEVNGGFITKISAGARRNSLRVCERGRDEGETDGPIG